MKKRVMTFGVFDGLHQGHLFLLEHARALGDQLLVAVAPDGVVLRLKHRRPKESDAMRMRHIKEFGIAHGVMLGDTTLNTWETICAHAPDIIALGYDQKEMRDAIEKAFPEIAIKIIPALKPNLYHSSIL